MKTIKTYLLAGASFLCLNVLATPAKWVWVGGSGSSTSPADWDVNTNWKWVDADGNDDASQPESGNYPQLSSATNPYMPMEITGTATAPCYIASDTTLEGWTFRLALSYAHVTLGNLNKFQYGSGDKTYIRLSNNSSLKVSPNATAHFELQEVDIGDGCLFEVAGNKTSAQEYEFRVKAHKTGVFKFAGWSRAAAPNATTLAVELEMETTPQETKMLKKRVVGSWTGDTNTLEFGTVTATADGITPVRDTSLSYVSDVTNLAVGTYNLVKETDTKEFVLYYVDYGQDARTDIYRPSGTDLSVSAINAAVADGEYTSVYIEVSAAKTLALDATATLPITIVGSEALTLSAAQKPAAEVFASLDFSEFTGLLLRSWLAPASIGFNFNRDQGTDTSGALEVSAWADTASATGTTTFFDGLTKITWSALGNYADKITDPRTMVRGYLDDGAGVSIAVTGIPVETYDVIIYSTTDTVATDTMGVRLSYKTVNGINYSVDADGNLLTNSTAMWGAANSSDVIALGRNAMRINNLSGPLTIQSVRADTSDTYVRGCISAIQIVIAAETTAVTVKSGETIKVSEINAAAANAAKLEITFESGAIVDADTSLNTGEIYVKYTLEGDVTVDYANGGTFEPTENVVIQNSARLLYPDLTYRATPYGEEDAMHESAGVPYERVSTPCTVVFTNMNITTDTGAFSLGHHQWNHAPSQSFEFVDGNMTVKAFILGDGGYDGSVGGQIILQKSGSINVTGTVLDGTASSTFFAHYATPVTYTLEGGTFTSAAVIQFGWDGTLDFIVGGGANPAVLTAPGFNKSAGNAGQANPAVLTVKANGIVNLTGATGFAFSGSQNDQLVLEGGTIVCEESTLISYPDASPVLVNENSVIQVLSDKTLTINAGVEGTGVLTFKRKGDSGRSIVYLKAVENIAPIKIGEGVELRFILTEQQQTVPYIPNISADSLGDVYYYGDDGAGGYKQLNYYLGDDKSYNPPLAKATINGYKDYQVNWESLDWYQNNVPSDSDNCVLTISGDATVRIPDEGVTVKTLTVKYADDISEENKGTLSFIGGPFNAEKSFINAFVDVSGSGYESSPSQFSNVNIEEGVFAVKQEQYTTVNGNGTLYLKKGSLTYSAAFNNFTLHFAEGTTFNTGASSLPNTMSLVFDGGSYFVINNGNSGWCNISCPITVSDTATKENPALWDGSIYGNNSNINGSLTLNGYLKMVSGTNNNWYKITCAVSGVGGFIQDDVNIHRLQNGNNSFTGGLIVKEGRTLQATIIGAVGAGDIVIETGAILSLANPDNLALANPITIATTRSLMGAGTVNGRVRFANGAFFDGSLGATTVTNDISVATGGQAVIQNGMLKAHSITGSGVFLLGDGGAIQLDGDVTSDLIQAKPRFEVWRNLSTVTVVEDGVTTSKTVTIFTSHLKGFFLRFR